jgi:hypothetical protein
VSNFLRRVPLSRLLLLCAVVVAVGVGASALAAALGAGPTPPPKPLADAVHDALTAPKVEGVSARVQFTNHLLEGSNLVGGGGEASQLASSPLLSGATGRLWIGSDGGARLELQSEKGDTQILWDGHTASLYDASTNTLYRYTPPPQSQGDGATPGSAESDSAGGEPGYPSKPAVDRGAPSVAKIEEGIAHAKEHADVSGATPTDVAGQAAYTVRVAPRENGGLIGGAELSWDAVHGVPLRAALYSTTSAAPVIELAVTEISYGAVGGSTLDFKAPADAKVREVKLPTKGGAQPSSPTQPASPTQPSSPTQPASPNEGEKPHVTVHGKGLGAIVLAESKAKPGEKESSQLEALPKVDVNGTSAAELPTALGTLLSFERDGVRYLLVGSVTAGAIEAFARSL